MTLELLTDAQALDHQRILALLAEYNAAGDDGRLRDYLMTFCEDGTLETPLYKARGRDAILSAIKAAAADTVKRPRFSRHLVSSVQVRFDGADRATVRAYYHVNTDTGPDHGGTYHDQVLRTAEGWRFFYRRVLVDWRSEHSLQRQPTWWSEKS